MENQRKKIRIIGKANTGANCVLYDNGFCKNIIAIANHCNQIEFEAYRNAKLYASPLNGSNWDKAISSLKDAGFEIFYG